MNYNFTDGKAVVPFPLWSRLPDPGARVPRLPVDMDMDRLELDLESLRAVIGPRCKVLVVAHLFGSRMDLARVAKMAREHAYT